MDGMGMDMQRDMIVRMIDGWSHLRHEVRVLSVLEKSSHDALAPGTCVTMPHLQLAFVSLVNRGR